MASFVRENAGAKKKFRVHSVVADVYGVHPFDLSRAELAGLYENIPGVKARRHIESGEVDPDAEVKTVRSLYLLAYDSEAKAESGVTAHLERQVRRSTK